MSEDDRLAEEMAVLQGNVRAGTSLHPLAPVVVVLAAGLMAIATTGAGSHSHDKEE